MVGRERRRRRLVGLGVAALLVVVGLLGVAPGADAAPGTAPRTGLCWYRSWFGGKHYCPANQEGIVSTRYGEGRRVWLGAANVVAVDDDTVTFAWPRGCANQDWFCDSFVRLTVGWEGPHRPTRPGVQVRLYGTTTAGSLVPAGYVRTGDCFYVWICPD